ncbi:hypothetical protein LCDV1gp057 [Lymphocystis disease virus 1]|uniref:hypothetical protein n=1 Tax=Fish lymphocystis disease virus TaxID=36363 RepID=UPI0000161EC3|nr:hypothetical protein LCDV1gp057 [Lymphocystis disease virus 1]
MCSNLIQYTFGVTEDKRKTVMTEEQLQAAETVLLSPTYPEYNKKLNDKLVSTDPKYALFSFVKTPEIDYSAELTTEVTKLKNLTKEFDFQTLDKIICILKKEKTIFGVAKVRGAFKTEKAARERACKIIKESDSLHSIMTCKIGVPFPLVTKGYARELNSINLKEALTNAFTQSELTHKKELVNELKEIEKRTDALKLETESAQDPIDVYITERVKSAHLQENILKNLTKLINCFNKLTHIETDSIKEVYLLKYITACQEVGLNNTVHIKYMTIPLTTGLTTVTECVKLLNYSES